MTFCTSKRGDTIAEVMEYVEYDASDCVATFRKMVDEANSQGKLDRTERKILLDAYRGSVGGYTYYE